MLAVGKGNGLGENAKCERRRNGAFFRRGLGRSGLAEALIAPVRLIKILPGADGDNTGRVNGFVAAKIVVADMPEIHGFRDARHLVNLAQEAMHVQIIADAMLVAFEMRHVDRVKTHKRRPQTNIGLGELVACEITLLTEDLLKPGQRGEHLFHRFVIRLLAGSEARFINAVIHRVVNPAVQLVDFCA